MHRRSAVLCLRGSPGVRRSSRSDLNSPYPIGVHRVLDFPVDHTGTLAVPGGSPSLPPKQPPVDRRSSDLRSFSSDFFGLFSGRFFGHLFSRFSANFRYPKGLPNRPEIEKTVKFPPSFPGLRFFHRKIEISPISGSFRKCAPPRYAGRANEKPLFSTIHRSALRARFRRQFGRFWPPFGSRNAWKSQEIDKKRRPENDRKTDVVFFDFRSILGTLFGARGVGFCFFLTYFLVFFR